MTSSRVINVIFDGPGRFVEVETDDGHSVNAGEWVQRSDGLWALRITEMPTAGGLERIGYLCIQGHPSHICSGCTTACCEPVFTYPEAATDTTSRSDVHRGV